ncbi:hypothetical protein RZS08_56490, partial [Arthrospira platensis SPKY1]|nr:hypothetical protein [Arthrospira platensis SPKY1]
NPVKYRSPYGSGSQLWLPQATIRAYQQGIEHDTLIVTEGEKKAEKLAIEGNLSVGIMGIHNFNARGEMPHYFFSILKKNNIKNVIFMLDTDWKDLSLKPGKP